MTAADGMASRLSRIAGSGYVRAVATLSSGQMIAAALPMLAAPMLGRLYLPADYGVLATYMAAGSVLSVTSTLQLQQGIIAERDERRAVDLVVVCRRASALVALVAVGIALSFFAIMSRHPAYAQARWWMLALPVTTLAAGWGAGVSALANRRGRYGMMARGQIYSVLATVLTSIGFGLMRWGPNGLFASYFVGQGISVSYQLLLYRQLVPDARGLSARRTFALARRHRRYVYFTLPSELMGSVQLQLPVFLLSGVGAASVLGAFTRARSLLGMPLTLLGASVGQVFRQRASEQVRQTGNCKRIYAQTFWVLLLFGLPPTILLMIFAPELFRIVLGPHWTEAGKIARIIGPTLLLQLVCSPISNVFYFMHYQRDEFVLGVSTFLLLLVSTVVVLWITPDPMAVMYVYAVVYSITYMAYILRGWTIASGLVRAA